MAEENIDGTKLPEVEDPLEKFKVTSEYDNEVEKWDPTSQPPYDPPTLVPRIRWGGAPPRYKEPLCTPIDLVLLLDTRTDFCTCEDTCGKVLREAQFQYMKKGLPDIPWNFMIGEDGKIYEGRGWVTSGHKTLKETEKYHGQSLDIAYIGNYQVKLPNEQMTSSLKKLINIGLTKGVLAGHHKMISEILNDYVEQPNDFKPK